MQHRMEAGLKKYAGNDVQIINYAVYAVKGCSQKRKIII